MNEILPPVLSDIIVENGTPTVPFYLWIQQVTEAVKAPLTGSGTPESNIIATVGRWYVDTSASAGTGIYFKQSGEGNTGWVLRS
tara:strand:+ start:276 stop:527 length:252 start_codon:yes stop_codon:yes gene_type:complete